MRLTYNKSEKLKSKKQINELFANGKSVSAYPLRLIFLETPFSDNVKIKTGVSVSKRNFKKAVDRIRIKRLMREAYRLNKINVFNNITTQYTFIILYLGKEKPSFLEIESATKKMMERFLKKIKK